MQNSDKIDGDGELGSIGGNETPPSKLPESNAALPSAATKAFNLAAFRPPLGLTRSAMACWFSIMQLIHERFPCFLWTLTTTTPLPDSYYGNMHAHLMSYMRDATRSGDLPEWGGVRVIEPNPKGHGLHYHWVMNPYLPIRVVRALTVKAGFGRIDIAQNPVTGKIEPCTPKTAYYLAKYLNKDSRVFGVRRWACIGNFTGTRTNDLEDESDSARIFKEAYRSQILAGVPNAVAFAEAKAVQARWRHNSDKRYDT